MIECFLDRLSQEIIEINGQSNNPIAVHIYFQSEIDCRYLMDACRRAGTASLRRLNNLLGLRRGLGEDVAFSCVIPDVRMRFSLPFVAGNLYALTQVSNFAELVGRSNFDDDAFDWTFRPFDYNQALNLGELFQGKDRNLEYLGLDGTDNAVRFQNGRDRAWAETGGIPPRFFWQLWGRLNEHGQEIGQSYSNEDTQVYLTRCSTEEMLTNYAELQTKGLRWVAERVTPSISTNVPEPNFFPEDFNLIGADIDTDTPSAAALEFARLENAAAKLDWHRERLKPIQHQILSGKALTLRNLRVSPDNRNILIAEIDSTGIEILNDQEVVDRLQIATGKRVRLVNHNTEARLIGQGHNKTELRPRFNGESNHTVAFFVGIEGGQARFEMCRPSMDGGRHHSQWQWPHLPGVYRWYSSNYSNSNRYWTMSESPDYVGGARIEDELEFTEGTSHHPMQGSHVNTWFDHSENADAMDPLDPLSDEETFVMQEILSNLDFEQGPFDNDSCTAILSMLRGRISQILGGAHWQNIHFFSSNNSGAAIQRRRQTGDQFTRVCISGPTNASVRNLLNQIGNWLNESNVVELLQQHGYCGHFLVNRLASGSHNGIILLPEENGVEPPTRLSQRDRQEGSGGQ